MKLIDGKAIAKKIQEELKTDIDKISGRKPGLAFILIGEDHASKTYVQMKRKGCLEVGIHSEILRLPADVTEKDLLKKINRLNNDPNIDGILIQQPFPNHISTAKIVEAIDPSKDVDGFHPANLGRLLLGTTGGFIACTPLGIMKMIERSGITTDGIEAAVIGRSNIVGKPLAALLIQKGTNATVTIAHSRTTNLKEVCKRADLLIAAIGRPHFITADMVKPGAVVIDVGINQTDQGLLGDVDFENVKDVASAITPVPGGVGPMTIATLFTNTYESYKNACKNIPK